MVVIEQCVLNFHIVNLHEKVLCDVVKMDACNLLFGSSWLFDRKVYHDGIEKTYEFKKDGKWYKLIPMPENTMESTKTCGDISTSSNKIMLYSSKEIL